MHGAVQIRGLSSFKQLQLLRILSQPQKENLRGLVLGLEFNPGELVSEASEAGDPRAASSIPKAATADGPGHAVPCQNSLLILPPSQLLHHPGFLYAPISSTLLLAAMSWRANATAQFLPPFGDLDMNSCTKRWPIERSWILSNPEHVHEPIASKELLQNRACVMLGAAGLGKTYELQYLADLDRQCGHNVRYERLAVLGQTPDSLAASLNRLVAGVVDTDVIYLDAFDEVMLPGRTTGYTIQNWVRHSLSERQPRLRISCRSAVWPKDLGAAIAEVYGEDNYTVAQLQPLTTADVELVASDYGLAAR